MDPTQRTVEIELNGKKVKLLFDLNTLAAFEEKSGKNFLKLLSELQRSFSEATENGKSDILRAISGVSVKDIHTLIWAASHGYGLDDEPTWEYSLSQVGRMLTIDKLMDIFPKLMTGTSESLPEKEKEEDSENPTHPKVQEMLKPVSSQENNQEDGGPSSGLSDEDALASLTES